LFSDLIGWIESLAAAPWFPFLVLAIALLDAIFPIVPSETAVITGGVAAGYGAQSLWVIIAAGALGAFIGDNLAYQIGRSGSSWVRRRASGRMHSRIDWASQQLLKRGGPLLVTARFIPGGRSAVTLASGLTHQPRGRFAAWVALAGLLWAAYGALLGYFFGERFQDDHTAAFLLAFGAALAVALVIEVVRRVLERRNQADQATDAEPMKTD
jgi:membrane protein DedA with SNARE-associated domain